MLPESDIEHRRSHRRKPRWPAKKTGQERLQNEKTDCTDDKIRVCGGALLLHRLRDYDLPDGDLPGAIPGFQRDFVYRLSDLQLCPECTLGV